MKLLLILENLRLDALDRAYIVNDPTSTNSNAIAEFSIFFPRPYREVLSSNQYIFVKFTNRLALALPEQYCFKQQQVEVRTTKESFQLLQPKQVKSLQLIPKGRSEDGCS